MEVILREDVDKLGRRGEVVKVTEGYGRNFLLPRGLALAVNEANKAMIAKERKGHEARMAKEKAEFQAVADRINGIRFVAPRKVGENDLLYGSVTFTTSPRRPSLSTSSLRITSIETSSSARCASARAAPPISGNRTRCRKGR